MIEPTDYCSGGRQYSSPAASDTGRSAAPAPLDQATFEVELDWLEGAAFLLVARTIGGHRPPGYYVSEGRRVRVHLIEALRKAGLLDAPMERRLKDVMKDSGEDGMSSQLKVLAAELRNNLEQLLGRIAVVFS